MDDTKQNIKMLEKAWEIQKLWEPTEGDIYAYWDKFENWNSGKFQGQYTIRMICNPGALGLGKLGMGCYENESGKSGELYVAVCEFTRTDDDIWLPTQNQLQEMVGLPLWQLNFKFIDWLCDLPYDGHIRHEHLQFTSMEQLWLAYVMHELYQKRWNGEDWVK